jgi:hypothetical protein
MKMNDQAYCLLKQEEEEEEERKKMTSWIQAAERNLLLSHAILYIYIYKCSSIIVVYL